MDELDSRLTTMMRVLIEGRTSDVERLTKLELSRLRRDD
jgi:hypothetical protein